MTQHVYLVLCVLIILQASAFVPFGASQRGAKELALHAQEAHRNIIVLSHNVSQGATVCLTTCQNVSLCVSACHHVTMCHRVTVCHRVTQCVPQRVSPCATVCVTMCHTVQGAYVIMARIM